MPADLVSRTPLTEGRTAQYRQRACRPTVIADAGGSNGYRIRAWKTELAAPATETVGIPRSAACRRALRSGT
ncbi:hypothetical protein GCM10010358_72580 [Streptomyces minutiscleroticus]|uniref:Transposase n=1 Tax=Streptomyces minutiscleroticus TaxID=68238 RepID=A0A918P0A3_9ACTN|nr:hypothetical protein GCM10010358_72580 [Streptomyces minutiscleroticus]